MTLPRMDNVGIVFNDLVPAIAFFRELGPELEGVAHPQGVGRGTQLTENNRSRSPSVRRIPA